MDFISNDSVIGKNCTIFQQVTIGSNTVDIKNNRQARTSPIIATLALGRRS